MGNIKALAGTVQKLLARFKFQRGGQNDKKKKKKKTKTPPPPALRSRGIKMKSLLQGQHKIDTFIRTKPRTY